MPKARPPVRWFVVLATAAMIGCGGANATPDTTGGKGGASSGVSSTGAAGTGAMGGTGGTGVGCSSAPYCDPAKWFGCEPQPITMSDCSDFDSDSNPSGIHCIDPGGAWQVDVDTAAGGTSKEDSWTIEPCGTTGNGFHFHGAGHSVWGADASAPIVSQVQPVDVSEYSGISFVMKSTTANSLIVKVQNPYSQPPCGHCDDTVKGLECYSGYTKTVSLPAMDATPIVVPWSDVRQQSWGYRADGTLTFDRKNLVSVAFAFDRGVDFDVCLDDIKFVR